MSTTEKIRADLSYFLTYGLLPKDRVIEAYGYRIGREGEGLVVWLPSKDYGFMAIERSKVKVYGGSTFKGDVKDFAIRVGRELCVSEQPLFPNDTKRQYIVNWKTQLPIKKFKEFYDERNAKDDRIQKLRMSSVEDSPSMTQVAGAVWGGMNELYASSTTEVDIDSRLQQMIIDRRDAISRYQLNDVQMDEPVRLPTIDNNWRFGTTDEMPF